MKVCIPIEFAPHGGGFYFLQALVAYFESIGWQVSNRLSDKYDVLFTNHWMVSRREILEAVRHNPRLRIVQRIDGAAQDYGREDDADVRQRAVNMLADLTIFQSAYCRFSTREKFPVIVQDGPIIHNPVDVERFTPEGPRHSFPQKKMVASSSWSVNPLKGAAQVYAVAKANPEVGFVLAGNYPDAPELDNLHVPGVLDHEELASVLRSCDTLLTFSQNEACPNHVLEALASGLPVLYTDSGAMGEVIGEAGLPVTVEDFEKKLEALLADKNEYSRRARQRSLQHFHPEIIFPQYVQHIQKTLESPPHIPVIWRLLVAWTDWGVQKVNWLFSGIRFHTLRLPGKKR
ncbi:MAG: glycosyltransferase [Chloroflexi bacterium]|nr:MAG: glycosyltransferase [Chloroflexota bacterium]MBL1193074.1 glycosyltransferase [Chloroflexota bacterium]NOH10367.1 glycosyltransferase family 4 protein [Chloroflexota bacterium]